MSKNKVKGAALVEVLSNLYDEEIEIWEFPDGKVVTKEANGQKRKFNDYDSAICMSVKLCYRF